MPRQRTTRRQDQQVYIANESFVANVNGQDKSFMAGLSRVYEGDEILDRCPNYFDLLEDHMAVNDRVT